MFRHGLNFVKSDKLIDFYVKGDFVDQFLQLLTPRHSNYKIPNIINRLVIPQIKKNMHSTCQMLNFSISSRDIQILAIVKNFFFSFFIESMRIN